MLYLWPCAIVLQICIVSFREFFAFHMHQIFLAKLSVLNVNTLIRSVSVLIGHNGRKQSVNAPDKHR